MGLACLLAAGTANAQWVVSDPGNLAQGIINTVKQIAQTSTTAKNTLDGFKETAKVFEQGKKYYDALKAVNDVIKGGVKVKKSHAESTRTETYLIRETDSYFFIETGLAVMLTYDKEKDRIHLSPGGEYKRSNHQLNK